jgi:hypothetical protein
MSWPFCAECGGAGAGAPLPPGGREPPEAHKLALLRELSTFITWRAGLALLRACLRAFRVASI